MLVDLGKAKRLNETPTVLEPKGILAGYNWRENDLVEFTLGKATPFKLISKGHINLQNRTELWRNDELLADKFYQLEVTLQPTTLSVTCWSAPRTDRLCYRHVWYATGKRRYQLYLRPSKMLFRTSSSQLKKRL